MNTAAAPSYQEQASIPQLIPTVYDELTRLARSQLAREYQPNHVLTPNVLVHEAYTKLVHQTQLKPKNRQHLIAIVGYAMRQVLVDDARARKAIKRGGGLADISLDDVNPGELDEDEDTAMVRQSLEELEKVAPRLAQVVNLRFIHGLTEEETASRVGTSVRTIQRDWVRAKTWLQDHLAEAVCC